jgi:hypothetical protein
VSDSLDTLAQQSDGYAATMRLQDGPGDAAGTGFSGALGRDVLISMQVDGANNALAQVQTGGGVAQNFYVQAHGADARDGAVYRVTGHLCASADSEEARAAAGLRATLTSSAGRKGVQMLAWQTRSRRGGRGRGPGCSHSGWRSACMSARYSAQV